MPVKRKRSHNYSRIVSVVVRRLRIAVLGLKRRFVSPRLPENPDGKILIHLGCGDVKSPELISVDTQSAPHIHYIADARDLSIFCDAYADLIYACHILEHFSSKEMLKILGEWRRVLKPGGILRISVPDFDKLIEVYEKCSRNVEYIRTPLMGYRDGYDSHCTIFNYEYLNKVLLKVGFMYVRQWDPAKVDHHNFDDWASKCIRPNGTAFHISLNVEAVK